MTIVELSILFLSSIFMQFKIFGYSRKSIITVNCALKKAEVPSEIGYNNTIR